VTNDSRISGLCEYEPSPVYADSQRVEYLEGQRVCRKRAPFIVATGKTRSPGQSDDLDERVFEWPLRLATTFAV
jgi:hypothetical protein